MENNTEKKTIYEKLFNKADMEKPYANTKEHLDDLFRMLDAYLNIACLIKEKKQDEFTNITMKEIAISENQMADILTMHSLEKSEISLSQRILDDMNCIFNHINNRVKISMENKIELRFIILSGSFGLSLFEKFCLILSISCDYNRNYETLYSFLQNDSNKRLPTKGLAISLYTLVNSLEEWEVGSLINKDGYLSKYIFNNHQEEISVSKLAEYISSKKRVVTYLLHYDIEDKLISELITLYDYKEELEKMIIHQDIFEKLEQVVISYLEEPLQKNKNFLIHIYGQKGMGKSFILKHLAYKLKIRILFFDVSILLNEEEKILEEKLNQVFLESVLSNSIICLTGVDLSESKEGENKKNNFKKISNHLMKELKLSFLLSEEKIEQLNDYHGNRISIEVPPLTAKEKIILWKEFSKEYKLADDIDLNFYGNRYILSAREITDILSISKWNSYARKCETIMEEDILSAIKQQQANQLGDYATLINAVFTWEDLIIEEQQIKQLKLICNQLMYRDIVGEEWGFNKKMPYGKGLSVLFYGVPGTGKTMAAQVIANELGLNLYRVDLSQLVSKYIGETEKNITGLFKKAKTINALLFFDEADALFAKRSEVKDSNDRNANMMTSHLLQKLEDYDGITILATNYINNIDDAFKRRIKFMVNFIFPSSRERYKLWSKTLPDKALCSEEIDFEFLAEKFEISGSGIKEILLNAAYLAVSEDMGITNGHIYEGIKIYFAKYGKILREEDFM